MTSRSVIDAVTREIDRVPNRSGDLEAVIDKGHKHRRTRIARNASVALALVSLAIVGLVSMSPGPDPSITPASGGETEHPDFMVMCLNAAGLTATRVGESERVDIDHLEIEPETLSRIIVDCRLRSGIFEIAEVSHVRELHSFLVELHSCLESEGYPVPELITADQFIQRRAQWHPYDMIWESSGADATPELQAAAQECPNNPDSPVFSD